MIPALFFAAAFVDNIRAALAVHDYMAADRAIHSYQSTRGVTPELAAAESWVARGYLDSRDFAKADAAAAQTRKMCDALLKGRKLDADALLPIALGASIEVHAQALAAEGARSEAIAWLQTQAAAFARTSIAERIHKNINLISLEGKPAPELAELQWLGSKPQSLASLRGKAVLLYFWAHWCSDCRAEAPLLADLQRIYGPRGLVLIGPTRLYGYAIQGEDASPEVERNYIEAVRRQFYPMLANVPVPVSAVNFQTYGASTTPTLVLIDRAGIVRMYHPGAMLEPDLARRIESVLAH